MMRMSTAADSKKTPSRNLPLLAGALLLGGFALGAIGANAQTVDTSEWVCEFCPFESGHRADYAAGASTVSEDSAYFDDASGYGDEGVVANVDGHGTYASENHRLEWTAEDLGLDARFAELRGGKPGRFGYKVGYREIPRRQFITTESVFRQSGGGALSLPAGWVTAGSTAGFTQLDASLAARDIESDRSIIDLGGRYLLSDAFTFTADYRRQEQDGVDILGGSYFTTASLLPMPFDYVTDEVDIGLRYAANNGFLALAWYLSDFEAGGDSFDWQSPFTTAPGAESAALAQPPDNRFQQFSLSGGYRFREARTYLNFSASVGQIEQDERLLPYTGNANLATTALPRTTLDGEVNTNNFAFSITSKAIDKARLRLSYRYDERDNETPRDVWNRVIADTFISGEIEANVPYAYERASLSLSADYDLFDSLRVSGGYDHKDFDRDFQEVAEQTVEAGWGRLRWRPNGLIDVNVEGGTERRDIDRYNETFAVSLGQNPLLRKYNLAFRYREYGELRLTASLPQAPVSVSLSGRVTDDSYTESSLGLTAADETRFAVDFNWTFSDTAQMYLTGGIENIESTQLGSESFAITDWRANNEDRFATFGGGLHIQRIAEKLDLRLDYTRSDGSTEIELASAAGGQSRFPDLESTLDFLKVELAYQRSERLEVAATLRYQRFETEDWALQGVGPATIPSVLSLGAEPYDDEILIFGIRFRYRVGGAETVN